MSCVKPPYYLSAYSLAVKAGFRGTLEQWLASLQGRNVELRYHERNIEWRLATPEGEPEDEWKALFCSDTIRDAVEEAVLADAQGYVGAAQAAAEQAKQAAASVPDTLPNPQKLILTGAVVAEYDGSGEVKVEIPEGGKGGIPEVHVGSERPTNGEAIWINPDEEPEDSSADVTDSECVTGVQRYGNMKPSFAWIDDDGKEKVSHLLQWAQTNNVPFTSALISGWIADGKKGWMTVDQVKNMHNTGLVTFASHTQNHVILSNANRETVEAELRNSKEQIESWGVPCEAMVYPTGAINDTDLDLVSKYYSFGFFASGAYDDNNIPATNRVNTCPISTYKLTRVDIRGDFTEENGGIAYVKGQIDDAIARNGLVVFMSHVGSTMIYDENGNATNTYLDASADLAVYTEILNYIRGKGYDIEPLMDVCERFANPVDVNGFAVGADGTVRASKGNVHAVAANNAYSMATLPSQYPQNQVTTCQIYDTTAPGGSVGILTAYVTDTLAYRTYMPKTSAKLYLQIKNSDADAWLDWVNSNQNDFRKLANNKILSTTAPSALSSGVTISTVASSTEIAKLPEGVQGVMTAYNLFADCAKAREEWQPNGSIHKYIRYATSGSAWSPWYVFTPTEYSV